MHHFNYRNDELYCEDVPVRHIAEAVGTPFYLYSHATLKRHYLAFDLGAESGRAMHASLEDGRLSIAEIHRFINLPVRLPDGYHWDALHQWAPAWCVRC